MHDHFIGVMVCVTNNKHRRLKDMLTTLGRLIRAIATVNVMITHEVFGNTLIILTLEFRVITGLVEGLR